MSMAATAPARSSSQRALSLALYAALVIGLSGFALASLISLFDSINAVDAASQLLAKMNRSGLPAEKGQASSAEMPGSPFLEGETLTIAGAALQQRVGDAVKKAGGNVLSAQTDLQGVNAAQGFVSLSANIELSQSALQAFLYDIEAGMPYLFIDTLAVQVPQGVGEADAAHTRVQIGVSGKWQPPG